MTEPNQDAQAAAVRALRSAAIGWMRSARVDYLQAMIQVVGNRQSGWIRSYRDNRPYDNEAPAELFGQMVRFREVLADPKTGAFTYAKFVVDAGSGRMSLKADPNREPQLDPPYTAQDCAQELKMFPRDSLRTPLWLSSFGHSRQKVMSWEDLDDEVLDRYKELVPEAVFSSWDRFGIAYLDDGLVRLVDPAHAVEKLQNVAPVGDDCVPVFTTALGDVIYWRPNGFILCDYRHGAATELGQDAEKVLGWLHDSDFRTRYLGAEAYTEAADRYGIPDVDDCFGYVPLLGLGGAETVNNLDPSQMWIHLAFIVQSCGAPQMG